MHCKSKAIKNLDLLQPFRRQSLFADNEGYIHQWGLWESCGGIHHRESSVVLSEQASLYACCKRDIYKRQLIPWHRAPQGPLPSCSHPSRLSTRFSPVISSPGFIPQSDNMVGATSASLPAFRVTVLPLGSINMLGTRFVV